MGAVSAAMRSPKPPSPRGPHGSTGNRGTCPAWVTRATCLELMLVRVFVSDQVLLLPSSLLCGGPCQYLRTYELIALDSASCNWRFRS